MRTTTNKDKFFVEQTLINLFRNRNPPAQTEKLQPRKSVEPPQNDRLRDVVEYKKVLEYKMNEADTVEKEERALLESRIQELCNARDIKAKMLEEQYRRDLEKLDRETSALIEQEKEFFKVRVKNKLCLSPKFNPKVDPIVVQEVKSVYKDSIKESTIQKRPRNSTAECNNLTTQILAKLADVKERFHSSSKAFEFSPNYGKEKENVSVDSSSDEDEYTLNTGRLRQLSLKHQREIDRKVPKEMRRTVTTMSPKEKQLKEEIMRSNSKIKQYNLRKY